MYPKLDNTGYNVVGGRVTGPAVGGLTLGGGFSWLTNQFGQDADMFLRFRDLLTLPEIQVSPVTLYKAIL